MNCNLLQDPSNKTVLCIGCGRGETTRELAAHMAGGGGRLIVTDISDEHFEACRANLKGVDLAIDYIRTSSVKLAGIRPGSIDLIVCNFMLSEINAVVGQGELTLHKMYEVLKPGGRLYLEEMLPYYMAASPAQVIWAEQWCLIKAVQILAGTRPSNEYQPDVLEVLVSQAGFEEVEITDELAIHATTDWWEAFKTKIEGLLQAIKDDSLKAALINSLQTLKENAHNIASMEVPYVVLTATKPWRVE